MNEIVKRITVSDEVCNGQPTIRGYRLSVQTIIGFIFAGTPEDEILKQYPFLEKEDLDACKSFALQMLDKKFTIKIQAA